MKISELTTDYVAEYLRIDDIDTVATREIEMSKKAAERYILNYTGQTIEYMEENEDITLAYLSLVADFYDNRQYQQDMKLKPNKTVECILGMHSINLLGGE